MAAKPKSETGLDLSVNLRRGRFGSAGRSGLERVFGYVNEERLPELSYSRKLRVYREMCDNSPVIGAMLYALQQLFRTVEWSTEPASEESVDMEAQEFIDDCLLDLRRDHEDRPGTSWPTFMSEVAYDLPPFGFSIHEIIYKRREDGKIGWASWEHRAAESRDRWEFELDTDRAIAFVQLSPNTGKSFVIPLDKCIHLRTTSAKGNPEGRSILRNAYRPWYYTTKLEEIEAIGIERDIAGLPIMRLPARYFDPSASDSEKMLLDYAQEIVRNVRNDEQMGLVLPSSFDDNGNRLIDFELLSAAGTRQNDTDKVIRRYEQRMLMVSLADFIMLGHEKVGSFALSSDKTDLFAVAIGGFLSSISEEIRWQAFGRLLRLNNMEGDPPILKHGDLEVLPLAEVGDFISKLTQAGYLMPGDRGIGRWARERVGLPEEDETSLEEGSGVDEGILNELNFNQNQNPEMDATGTDTMEATEQDEQQDDTE